MYDYRKGKENIVNIIQSNTKIKDLENVPNDDSKFIYDSGIKAWVGAIFIDIIDSATLFSSEQERVARLMRSFTAEIITILESNDNYRQIGIRGDCVYGIYSISNQMDLVDIFNLALTVNTFMIMFNKIMQQNDFPEVKVGIGLGCGEDLILKAGKKGTSINDKIWIGDAVVDAANLSSLANRGYVEKIAMNCRFYANAIEILKKENEKYLQWITRYKYNNFINIERFYHCDIVNVDFSNWIDNGMG